MYPSASVSTRPAHSVTQRGKTPPEQAVFRLDPTGRGKEGFQRGEDAGAVLRAEEIVWRAPPEA